MSLKSERLIIILKKAVFTIYESPSWTWTPLRRFCRLIWKWSYNQNKVTNLQILHVHVVILLGFGGSFFMFKQWPNTISLYLFIINLDYPGISLDSSTSTVPDKELELLDLEMRRCDCRTGVLRCIGTLALYEWSLRLCFPFFVECLFNSSSNIFFWSSL